MTHASPADAPDPDLFAFETLIANTSADLMGAADEAVDQALEAALDRIRVFFGADRCGLLAVNDSLELVHVRYGAYADDVVRVTADVNLAGLFPWSWARLVLRRELVVIPRVADLPPEAARDRESFQALSTRSNLTIPVQAGASRLHLVMLGAVKREVDWHPAHVKRLRLLAEILVNRLERADAYQALRTSEERRMRAAAAAGCGLWEMDPADGATWVSVETRTLFGLSPDEAPSRARFEEVIHPDDRDRVRAAIVAAAGEGDRLDVEHRIRRGDGSERWIHAVGRRDAVGRLLGASVDVTDLKAREDELKAALAENARLRDRLEHENLYLRREVSRADGGELVTGRSPAIGRALRLADQVAPTAATVLLVGETGTGKERFAEYIHRASPRRGRPMVRVNCSAIPSALIESELFGREKGAYTGALSRQIGRFELAHGSTLFLDEIGDLPLEVQVKLLRVLQERTIERLGSSTPLAVDVRIVAATHRDLEAAVTQGTFRSDLYYRINVFPIVVPPLRERREDIPLLASLMVDELGAAMRKRVHTIAKGSLDALQRHDWPGNVRELRNLLERAMILADGPVLDVTLPSTARAETAPAYVAPPGAAPPGDLSSVEREHILAVLHRTGWRVRGGGGAAEVLGLKPTTLEARMARLGIGRPSAAPRS